MAESWDKVGLLVHPDDSSEVNAIMIANDLTMSVVEVAKSKSINLIMCYHPLIFSPFSSLSTTGTWQEKVVIECIKYNISVYCFHTVMDNIKNGVNDHIAKSFSYLSIEPIVSHALEGYPYKMRLETKKLSKSILNLIENNDVFLDFDDFDCLKNIWFSKVPSPDSLDSNDSIIENISSSNYQFGSGRLVKFKNSLTISEVISKVKEICSLPHVSVATLSQLDMPVFSIGICAGAGGSLLREAVCDVCITGEMSHHDTLSIIQNGKHVIITDHTNSENPFLLSFPRQLKKRLIGLGITNIPVEYNITLQYFYKGMLKLVNLPASIYIN
ncbi:hypothetical protein MXB_2974 [Myxobolus squamalis]|nr:hypothetical protein MXB_2974 [Myxobolus squamalis]